MFSTRRAFSTIVFTAALLSSAAALAEDPPQRVGRISYIEGTVSFHAANEDNWSYATLNYPVTSGNAFWTEPNGRSEVQVGAVEIRMDHGTELEVNEVDQNATQIGVPQGVVNIHFATPPLNGSVEVLTPAGAVELTKPGTYHIDSGQPTADGSAPQVQVTALEGQLEVKSPRAVLEVMPGETAVLSGNPPAFSLVEGNPTDFDNWALARERREEAHQTAQYVSPHTTGYEDLDNYGQWSADPSYGQVWYPTAVQSDWAPYRYGHWAYVAPWGWTWVDDAPWGFAPFHYGRWAYVGNRWGWVPGEVVERPCYAPALVAFVGGAGWSVSIGIGGESPAVGWVPLAPHEVFHPYYPTSVNYMRNVNIANVNRTEINNITVNNYKNVTINHYANAQRAATVVPAGAFEHGQPVHKALVTVPRDQLVRAPVTSTLAHVPPAAAAMHEGRAMPASAAQPHAEHVPMADGHAEHPGIQPRPGQPTPQVQAHEPAPEARPEQHNAHQPAAEPQRHTFAEQQHSPAPGPVIHRPQPAQQPHPEHVAVQAQPHEQLPRAEVQHPVQHTQIAPTPRGWQRQPVPQHQEQGHPAPHPAGQPQHEEHRVEPGQH